jgi:sulfatase modifying factor 1
MNENSTLLDLGEIDTRQRWQQRPPEVFPSPWACEWGFDEYGLWQCFIIKGIRCKMRYIPPGSFLMGSPKSEPERDNDETQHQVTLTHGFWLGETTVSQPLWQVVTGNNPSYCKPNGDEISPVEEVRWDDCQEFCTAANKLIPNLALTLPTEAQWEYACRAGTQTPFSTGAQLTTAQANYHGDYPYNKGKKGVFRAKTVAVDSFAPNAWGLWQMHGNVWEWCQDGLREYDSEPVINPKGEVDGPQRALRGGGWRGYGSFCRSAYRGLNGRDNANRSFGLRLVQVL